MARLIATCLIAMTLIAACDADPARPGPSQPAAQIQDCGNVDVRICRAAVQAVIARVPETATSPIAVVATLDPNALARRGRDLTLVVAFQRLPNVDVWMDPPTWLVTRTFSTQDWWIAPWRNRDLPAHFQRLLVADGVVR
jgi:hypothetical protein